MRPAIRMLCAACVVACVVWPVAAQAATAPRVCPPATALLLAANEYSSVWQVPRRSNVANRYYACRHIRHRSKPILLGRERGIYHLSLFTLAQRYLAYKNEACGRDAPSCEGAVVVRDLWANTVRRARIPDDYGGIGRLVLSARGAIAWITIANSATGQIEVRVLDSRGERVLASGIGGTEIDVDSLAISKSRVYWFQNGQVQSADVGRY